MNILKEAQRSLAEAFAHYVCMRFKFRASVLRDEESKQVVELYDEACHCCPAP